MNNEQIYNDAKFQQAWDDLCNNLGKLAILIESYYYAGAGKRIQEATTEEKFEEKFKYLIRIINENINTIIRCLGFDPLKNEEKGPIFRRLSLSNFNAKRDLERNLSKENLIKLQGKIESVSTSFIWFFEDNESNDPLMSLREELSEILKKFKDYISEYNKYNPGKEIAGLSECLKLWFKSDSQFKSNVLSQWKKDLKTNNPNKHN
jgi:hypothetical protein